MRDFPYLRLGIRDFKGKSERDSGLKVCAGSGMPKVTLGITGLPENLGRDYGIEKPYWGPSVSLFLLSFCENERCTCVYVNSEIITIIVVTNFLNNRNLLIIKYVN